MPALPALALATAVVGTGYSIYAGERANSMQKKANTAEAQRNDLATARQRRDAIREARVAYGQSQQSAENQGVASSSAALGGQASVASQLNSNMSFLDQYSFLTDQASTFLGKAQAFRSQAQTAGDIGSLGFTVFNNRDSISKVFKG